MPRVNENWKVRDAFGRDLSYITSCLPTLSDLNKIDLYSIELESGYTPLHVTLREGLLRKSFLLYKSWKDEQQSSHRPGGHILNQRDREGLTPIELYNIELQRSLEGVPKYLQYMMKDSLITPEIIYDRKREGEGEDEELAITDDEWHRRTSFMEIPSNHEDAEMIRKIGGSHLLTLGSNVNAQLGTGNKDDRSKFFQLDAQKIHGSSISPFDKPLYIKKILMSRYHSVVIDSSNEVFSCGNSNRGRLGNGETNTTVSSYVKIMELEDGIRDVSISNHHNLLVDGNGNVYSWGWNIYHQLGYNTGNRTKDNIGSLHKSTPKKIPFLEGENIKLVACSKIHSCALTATNKLYLWGLNVGQLGSSKSTHVEFDTQYNNTNGYVVTSPIIMDFSNLDVQQIICTEFVTFIRSAGNNLTVLSNFSSRSFKIPLPKTKQQKKLDIFSHYVPKTIPTNVIDMKCSNSYGNHICFKYAGGKIGKLVLKNEGIDAWSKLPNELPVTAIWTPNLAMNRCMDFAVSLTGNIILCTHGGEVYMTQGVKLEKVHSSKLITGRAVSVCSDPSFGSFGILKQDFLEIPAMFPKDPFYYDLFKYSPYYQPLEKISEYGLLVLEEQHRLTRNSSALLNEKPVKAEFESKILSGLIKRQSESTLYDATFCADDGSLICKSFMALLYLRCSKFISQLVNNGRFTINQDLFFTGEWETNRLFKITVHDTTQDKFYKELPEQLLHSILTGSKPLQQQYNLILLRIIDDNLHSTKLDTYLSYYATNNIFKDESAKTKLSLYETSDTILKLSDGILSAHSFVLAARCPYFDSMFQHKAFLVTNDDGKYQIDLTQYTIQDVTIMLKYIYGVDLKTLIKTIAEDSNLNLIDMLIDSLILADLFCMESFKYTLESILCKYINGSTVVHLLVFAVRTNSEMLMTMSAAFISIHIGVLFASENLEDIDKYFDKQIWEVIENAAKQISKPFFSGPKWYYDTSKDWRALFIGNISNFNGYFNNSKNPIAPVFDLNPQTSTEAKRKSSTSNRRRSSVYQKVPLDEPIPTIQNKNERVTLFKNVWESSSTTSVVEEESDFIEVGKRSKKRTSSASTTPPNTAQTSTRMNISTSDVVIHKSLENSDTSLPSLLSNGKMKSLPKANAKDDNHGKKSISFKKTSQKQRLKLSTKDEEKHKSSEANKKGPWDTNKQEQNSKNSQVRNNSTTKTDKNALPSLNDQLSKDDLKPKKKNQRRNSNKQPVEFISSGNHAGITPYLSTGKIDTSLPTNNEPSWTASSASDFKQKLEAQEFEKWFQEESERIQRELKKQGKSHQDELNILYNSAQNIPTFIDNSKKNSGRKIKGKFKAKIKVNAGNINENII